MEGVNQRSTARKKLLQRSEKSEIMNSSKGGSTFYKNTLRVSEAENIKYENDPINTLRIVTEQSVSMDQPGLNEDILSDYEEVDI